MGLPKEDASEDDDHDRSRRLMSAENLAQCDGEIAVVNLPRDHAIVRLVDGLRYDESRHSGVRLQNEGPLPRRRMLSKRPADDFLVPVADFMASHGFPLNLGTPGDRYDTSWMIERYDIARTSANEPPSRPVFGVHQDAGNFGRGGCSSLLVYLRSTCVGGGLEIYEHEYDPRPKVIDTRASEEDFVRVVLLDGAVWHNAEPARGVGDRSVVVLQWARAPAGESD